MDSENFKKLIQQIVNGSSELKNKYTTEKSALVNFACIFCQSDSEYSVFLKLAKDLGEIIQNTPTGPLFKITPIQTVSGDLILLKIRIPDSTRKERGDADFTVSDYVSFKKNYLKKEYFSLIERENFEMIELYDKNINYRAYFSYPTLIEQLKLK